MSSFLIIVPTMHEAVMDKCYNSIDSKYFDNLYLIDNSPTRFAHKYGVANEHYPENIGIPRAWNIGVKKVLEQKLDYLIIMSATMVFDDAMHGWIEAVENNTHKWGITNQHNWHLIALRREVFETIGDFDTNFYPAYFEDSDFIRRMELAGMHNPMNQAEQMPKIEIAAHTQGDAHALKKTGLKVNFGALSNYFIEKWGCDVSYESQDIRDKMFKSPYGVGKHPLSYYHKKSIEQLKREYRI